MFFVPVALIDRFVWSNPSVQQALIEQSALTFELFNNFMRIFVCVVAVLYFVAILMAVKLILRNESFGFIRSYHLALMGLPGYLLIKAQYVVKVVLWGLLLVVPGIIYGAKYSLSGVAFLIDGKKREEAFHFSQKITRSKLATVLISAGGIIIFVIAVLFPLVYLCDFLIDKFYLMEFFFLSEALDQVEFFIIVMTLFCLPAVFIYFLYEDLKGFQGEVKPVGQYKER